MSTLELIRALYDYNEWANNHLLDAAGKLTAVELERPFPASFGSVEANLAHILAGQVVWLQRWTAGTNPRPLTEVQAIRGLDAIRSAFCESHQGLRRYVGAIKETDLDCALAYTDSRGNPHERVVWQLLVHLVNHGTHHRAETAMAMAALGKPMHEMDYHFFELERA